ncbi:rhamnogalacturonan acetylesterase [Glaciecola sp. 1036]|uniref:rhamnogalacturonan acetylesterase n=1 Tax=Alteromonadaceae TaxID=72275 RepID=UPI003CFE9429
MNKGRILALLSICSFLTMSFVLQAKTTQIFMAGDSTMSIKDPKDYPETGWGVPFATFFDESVEVINLAKNGRSTRTFISEGLWQQIEDNVKAEDTVFIQFGHNDQSEHKKDRYTTPEEYEANLLKMINISQKKEANVVLMTPISRRHFDEDGSLRWTHPYADIVRKIAKNNESVTFIDMEKLTHDYIVALGEKDSALRFMHIQPDLHPNYPYGVRDNTHLNRLGARELAQIVLTELKKKQHPVTTQLRKPDPKHLKLSY